MTIDSQELYRSEEEAKTRIGFVDHFKKCPIPDDDILQNLGLFISSKNLSRILFMDHIYQQIVNHHGVVFEFGTRWGQNLAIFSALRGIYEPFNRMRKIIGFDTFTGFPSSSLSKTDNLECDIMHEGGLACTKKYQDYLEKVMEFQEKDNPMSHIKKFDVRAGDASKKIHEYLEEFPETIVSLAFFDFDIYEPTKVVLEAIRPRCTKGTLLAFDELNDHDSPGETIALMETFGLNNVRLKRHRYCSRTSYFMID